MSFFNRLFGSKDPIEQLRRAVQQKRWADALVYADALRPDQLSAEAEAERQVLLAAAGDALATLNIEEAEACQRTGDLARAAEHFQLAERQARSPELHQRIAASRSRTATTGISGVPKQAPAHDCHTSCSSGCTPGDATKPGDSFGADLDAQTRWELLLATFPPALAERYNSAPSLFQQAVLAAYEGETEAALAHFERISSSDRDDLFFFERGSMLAQTEDKAGARRDFARALEIAPGNFAALDALTTLEMENGWESAAEKRLEALVSGGKAPLLCMEKLALLKLHKGEREKGVQLAELALNHGSREPQLILTTANLLEEAGNLADAEAVLGRLEGGGGCGGGGTPVALAEFWLRHGRHLDRALESFKAATRHEGDNPRWALRIGQTYLAKGWKKEGIPLVQAALADPRLSSQLQQEGHADLLRAMQP